MNHYLFKYAAIRCKDYLTGKRVSSVSIHSPSSFSIYFKDSPYRIYLDLSVQSSFFYTTTRSPKAFKTSESVFFVFLKKRLPGMVLSDVIQRNSERLAYFYFDDIRGELKNSYVMIIEMIDRMTNAIFTDSSFEILQAYKHTTSQRQILPHKRYVAPVMDMPDLLCDDLERLILRYRHGEDILGFGGGLRRLVSSELEFIELVKAVREVFDTKRFELCLYNDRDVYPFRFLDKPCRSVDDDFVYERYVLAPRAKDFENRKRNLLGVLTKRLRSLKRRYKKIQQELSSYENAEKYRIMAENLLAHPNMKVEHKSSVTLEDIYTSKPITIALNPDLSLFENASLYFKRFKKAVKGRQMMERRLNETKLEMDLVEQLIFDVEAASDERELEDVRDIMIKEGIIKTSSRKDRRANYLPYEHKVIEGYDVYIGKNARGNDYVTLKLASKNDLWFHAHGRVGAHLVLKNPSRLQNIDDRVKMLCAKEVAKRTKASRNEKVEVAYTFAKYVKKPKGFKTGLVLYSNFKTLTVEKE